MDYQDCAVTIDAGKPTEKTNTYKQIIRKSLVVDDVRKLLSDEKTAQDVIDSWWYGQDLKAKSQVRNALLDQISGPEKTIEKLAKDLFKARAANGKPITEAQSVQLAKKYLEMESSEPESSEPVPASETVSSEEGSV